MNERARQLGALDTVARTPSGLDVAGQTSSAYDLALIARAGLGLPEFRRYVATRRADFPAPGGRRFEIYTHNRLLVRYPGALGVKNGFTSTARASFVGAARRGDRTLVVTLLRAQPRVWDEAARLLDWGFTAGARARPVGTLVEPEPDPALANGRLDGTNPHAASLPVPPPGHPPLAPFGSAALVASGLLGLRMRARDRAAASGGRQPRSRSRRDRAPSTTIPTAPTTRAPMPSRPAVRTPPPAGAPTVFSETFALAGRSPRSSSLNPTPGLPCSAARSGLGAPLLHRPHAVGVRLGELLRHPRLLRFPRPRGAGRRHVGVVRRGHRPRRGEQQEPGHEVDLDQ